MLAEVSGFFLTIEEEFYYYLRIPKTDDVETKFVLSNKFFFPKSVHLSNKGWDRNLLV